MSAQAQLAQAHQQQAIRTLSAAGVLPQPPPELQQAINSSAQKYGVPADLLAGIWRIESGSTFPNNAVNSSGYGGLFGTRLWNGSTQAQADLAASILAAGLRQSGGNIGEALSYYNSGKLTGGYTSVPGETTFGTWTGRPGLPAGSTPIPGSGLFNPPHGKTYVPAPGTGGLTTPGPIKTAEGAFSAIGDFYNFLTSWRFVEMIAGFLLLLAGLYLVARQFGVNAVMPGPAGAATKAVGDTAASQAGTEAAYRRGEQQGREARARSLGRERASRSLEDKASTRRRRNTETRRSRAVAADTTDYGDVPF